MYYFTLFFPLITKEIRLFIPIMKRFFDFFVSALCLVLFSPLFLLCYLVIKIGGGPAIYKQERIGKGGRPFYIYKFRSMKVDAEKEGEELLQVDNDPD